MLCVCTCYVFTIISWWGWFYLSDKIRENLKIVAYITSKHHLFLSKFCNSKIVSMIIQFTINPYITKLYQSIIHRQRSQMSNLTIIGKFITLRCVCMYVVDKKKKKTPGTWTRSTN